VVANQSKNASIMSSNAMHMCSLREKQSEC